MIILIDWFIDHLGLLLKFPLGYFLNKSQLGRFLSRHILMVLIGVWQLLNIKEGVGDFNRISSIGLVDKILRILHWGEGLL